MSTALAWLVVLLAACAMGALAFVWARRGRKPGEMPLPAEWLLTPRPVFNPHERRVFRQLREALPEQVILAKLPLVRFCHPTDGSQVRYWFDLLGAIHVSFAVCAPTGRVLAAIDLDDDDRSAARRSVQIKKAVLAACHIRYVRYRTEQVPTVPELQLLAPAAAAVAPGAAAAPSVRARAGVATPSNGAHAAEPAALAGAPSRWPDSTFAKDSTFGRDSVISGFAHSRPSELPEIGGEVVDPPRQKRR
jgi:hypothetical protein